MNVNLSVEHPQQASTMLIGKSIAKVLAYFDMFAYPLSLDEIRLFLDRSANEKELKASIDVLIKLDLVFCYENFYMLRNDPALIHKRKEGNARAQSMLSKARKIARFLYWFPFVRGIGISGSLSKNVASPDADIDFFIITRSNRLWIARTFMHLFKKLTFLAGRQHWFCMNYYVDEHALQIQEQNIFTATEVITLVPAQGNGVLTNFFGANNWVTDYFPNQSLKSGNAIKPKETIVKRCIEACLNNSVGEKLDNYLMKLTTRRWKQKELHQQLNMNGRRMGLYTGKHFARPNPEFFQQKVLRQYAQKLELIDLLQRDDEVVAHYTKRPPVL